MIEDKACMYDFLRKNPAINLVKKNIIMQTQYKSWPCLHVDMVKDMHDFEELY